MPRPLSYLARSVADSLDRDAWQAARRPGLGASDVASFSKLESADLYATAKLKSGTFRGNADTERGHHWEAAALSAYGYAQNTIMFHAEGQPRHLATPDGIRPPSSAGVARLAQVKTKRKWNGRIAPTEQRQMLWEQYVMGPEFRFTDYLVLPFDEHGNPTQHEPTRLVFERDDEKISRLLVIADAVLLRVGAALEFERRISA